MKEIMILIIYIGGSVVEKEQYPRDCNECKIFTIMKSEKLIGGMCCYGCPNRRKINEVTQ
jgi:hypothetical protein